MPAPKSILSLIGPALDTLCYDGDNALFFAWPKDTPLPESDSFVTDGVHDSVDGYHLDLDVANYSDLRTACKALKAPFLPGQKGLDGMRDAIRRTDPDAPAPAPAPTPDPTPIPKDTTPMPIVPDTDGLAAARAALGVTPEFLAAIITPLVEAGVAEGLKDVRPVQIVLPERPEPTPIKGKAHKDLERVLRLVRAGVTPFLQGPAGTGKSTLARQVAEAMGLDKAGTLPTNPSMSEVKLLGYMDANGRYVRTEFREVWEHGGVFLLDEIDCGHPAIVKGFNELLECKAGQAAAFPDGMVPRSEDCILLAAANTFGKGATAAYVGGFELDASTRNRFTFLVIDYDTDLERDLAKLFGGAKGEAWAIKVQSMRANVEAAGLRVVVSTRDVVEGAKLLAAGFSEAETFAMRIGETIDKSTAEKVTKDLKLAA